VTKKNRQGASSEALSTVHVSLDIGIEKPIEFDFYGSRDRSESDLIILRVARILGECELGMPDEFRDKVYEYINEWKKSRRLQQAMRRAADIGMGKIVTDAMLEYDLPSHFFFLALQESGFNEKAISPATRFGIARGIWQFIPTTASRYGLEVGPLVELAPYAPPRPAPRGHPFDPGGRQVYSGHLQHQSPRLQGSMEDLEN
jgi:hypothetical protein